jgi:hypothetical protein
LNKIHRISKNEAKKAFEKLQEMKYGKITEQRAQNNLITIAFEKIDLPRNEFTEKEIIEKYGEYKFKLSLLKNNDLVSNTCTSLESKPSLIF